MDARLTKFIATRDRRIAKRQPWSPTPLAESFRQLMERGSVKVGGRASCGGAVDPTWVQLCAWKEVVSKARTFGYEITEEAIKHGNGWATKAGGFWEESEYRLGRSP